MSDYINRDAFVRDKRKQYCSDCNKRKGYRNGKVKICYEIGDAPCRSCGIGDMLDDVEDYPAADVRENVRGHWIHHEDDLLGDYWECSNCHDEYTIIEGDMYYDFCPGCGADMREERKQL